MTKTKEPEQEEPPQEIESNLVVIPHNREAEEAVVGSVLIDPACWKRLTAILKNQDFYIVKHRWIWQAFEHLAEKGEPLDFITVPSELTKMGRLKEIGGDAYLTKIIDHIPSSLNAESYAGLVKKDADKRSIIEAINEAANIAYDQKKPIEDVISCLSVATKKAIGNLQERYVVRDSVYMLEPVKPEKYLVEGLIYEKSITVLYGDGGTKKTWAGLYLGACVASGNPWGDLVTTKTKVLYIDEEMGDSEMHQRGQWCIKGATLTNDPIDLKYVSLAGFHLDNPHDEEILTNEILAQGAGLVIFDALADLMLGDENSKQDTQPVFNALRRIVEKTGAAIVVIHHTNKTGGQRGSSVIKDAPDIMCKIESDRNSNFINFETEKNRKSKCVKWSMFATWAEDRFYLSHTERQEKPKQLGKAEEYVIRYLTDHGASELKIIMGGADTCSPEGARQAVYALARTNTIHRTNPSDSDKVHAIYDLTNKE